MTQGAIIRVITLSLGFILLIGYFSHEQLDNYYIYDMSFTQSTLPIPLNSFSEVALVLWPLILMASFGIILVVFLSFLAIEKIIQRKKIQIQYKKFRHIRKNAQQSANELIKKTNDEIEKKINDFHRDQEIQIEANKAYLKNEKERILNEYKQQAYQLTLEQVNQTLEKKKLALNKQHHLNLENKKNLENWHARQEQHYQSKKQENQKLIDAKNKKLKRSKHQIQRLKTQIAKLDNELMEKQLERHEEEWLSRYTDF